MSIKDFLPGAKTRKMVAKLSERNVELAHGLNDAAALIKTLQATINDIESKSRSNTETLFAKVNNSGAAAFEENRATALKLDESIEIQTQLISRIVRLEGMYVDVFKMMNDNFQNGMQALVSESANVNKYAAERIDVIKQGLKEDIDKMIEQEVKLATYTVISGEFKKLQEHVDEKIDEALNPLSPVPDCAPDECVPEHPDEGAVEQVSKIRA